jgi:hypothetical protein
MDLMNPGANGSSEPRILIASPITPSISYKKYCVSEYFSSLNSISYKNAEILLLFNGGTMDEMDKMKKEAGKKINLEFLPMSHSIIETMVSARNFLRQKVLDDNFDYLLFLEQDIIPPGGIVEKLLSNKKSVCSGLYFNLQRGGNRALCYPGYNPMAWDFASSSNGDIIEKTIDFDRLFPPSLIRVDGCGLGCVLIHKDVLSKIEFRSEKGEDFEEFFFAQDCKNHGIDIFVDTSIICRHYVRRGSE